MAVTIGSNIISLGVQRRLAESSGGLARVYERLASGARINRASDDAAGLAIASRLQSESRVYAQAIRNANDGLSALSIAQDTMANGSNILVRLRELATSAANGTFSRTQRISLNKEALALVDEFNRATSSADFNGRVLVDGSLGSMGIQLGYGSSGQLTFRLGADAARSVGTGYGEASVVQGGHSALVGVSASGDLNGDGREDILYSDTGSNGIIVQLATSAGGLGAVATLDTSHSYSQLKLADLNGDGALDIVGASYDGIRTFINNGNGTFAAGVALGTGKNFTGVEVIDFNNDGILDIAGIRSTTVLISYVASSPGNYTGTTSTPVSANQLQKADIDGDGQEELLSYGLAALSVYGTSSSGTLSLKQTLATTATDLRIGDFNRDGLADIAYIGGGVFTSMGDASGTLGAATKVGSSGSAYIQIADLNGDGFDDIGYTLSNTFQTLNSDANGSFTAGASRAVGGGGIFAIADVNGDGIKDLIEDALLGVGPNNLNIYTATTSQSTNVEHINITTRAGALEALSTIDVAMARIDKELGNIGAIQSRLGSALNTLATSRENYLSAESRIKDADIGAESANLVRLQILQQGSAALLGQANQSPALALKLLSGI